MNLKLLELSQYYTKDFIKILKKNKLDILKNMKDSYMCINIYL